MIILNEVSSEVSKQSKVFSNKLKNMHLHLTELLNKKIRLEIEIKNLQKTIVKKQKEYEKTLKVKLTMETTDILDDLKPNLHIEDPNLYSALIQFDEISLDIQELIEEINSEKFE